MVAFAGHDAGRDNVRCPDPSSHHAEPQPHSPGHGDTSCLRLIDAGQLGTGWGLEGSTYADYDDSMQQKATQAEHGLQLLSVSRRTPHGWENSHFLCQLRVEEAGDSAREGKQRQEAVPTALQFPVQALWRAVWV